ncbi:hypothetical protein SDC9_138040 [bioreactor metagenome]|uniref:Uncharacterized protein n=1 Tax=bioreactor metagenome TaxID=1076179 RepID=A0A645DNQ0_9ZZZZ
MFKLFHHGGCRGEHCGDRHFLAPLCLQRLLQPRRPALQLGKRKVRAADKAHLRLGIRLFPDAGVTVHHPLQLGIVNHIGIGLRRKQCVALLYRLRGKALHMVQPHRPVGCRRRPHVFQVILRCRCQLIAQIRVKAADIRHFFQHLHANGAAQHLRGRQLGRFQLYHPRRTAALVGQQAKLGHKPGNAAKNINNARIAVAPRAQHTVGIHYSTAFCPAEHLPLLWRVAGLGLVAGAGKGIVPHQPQLLQPGFVFGLF